MIAAGVDAELDEARSLARRQQAPHPRHRGARAAAHRHRLAQDPLQPGLRLLDRDQPGPGRARAGRLRPPPDAGQRRALRDARDPGARGEDPARRGAPARARARRTSTRCAPRSLARRRTARRRSAARWATVDVLAGWAELAAAHGWHAAARSLPAGSGVRIAEGRHPVVERALARGFVPNDCDLDPDGAQIVLLTGPNMGGKSTYLRQVALIVLLAQAGCFVPARARVDRRGRPHLLARRSLRRSGARRIDLHGRDDRDRQHPALRHRATAWSSSTRSAAAPRPSTACRSPGRSSSTCTSGGGALTLFATHYHELTELADAAAAGGQPDHGGARSGRSGSSSCAG